MQYAGAKYDMVLILLKKPTVLILFAMPVYSCSKYIGPKGLVRADPCYRLTMQAA